MKVSRFLGFRGGRVSVTADDTAPLLDVLKRELGARDVVRGCHDGRCGACRVIVDGDLVRSCALSWSAFPDGALVESYNDVQHELVAAAAVTAFEDLRPTRCRLCVASVGVVAVALHRRSALTDADAIDDAVSQAYCACTGRVSLRCALERARLGS